MAVTGWSEFWGGANVYAPRGQEINLGRQVARLLARKVGGVKLKTLMIALNGSAVGGASTATRKEVESRVDGSFTLGGARTIATRTMASGVTVAADETRIDAILNEDKTPAYVRDLSGNGAR